MSERQELTRIIRAYIETLGLDPFRFVGMMEILDRASLQTLRLIVDGEEEDVLAALQAAA